jgi:hypothetical protein
VLYFSPWQTETYKVISVRLFQCALLYGVLSNGSSSDAANGSAVYNLAAGFLYADTLDNYKREILKAKTENYE